MNVRSSSGSNDLFMMVRKELFNGDEAGFVLLNKIKNIKCSDQSAIANLNEDAQAYLQKQYNDLKQSIDVAKEWEAQKILFRVEQIVEELKSLLLIIEDADVILIAKMLFKTISHFLTLVQTSKLNIKTREGNLIYFLCDIHAVFMEIAFANSEYNKVLAHYNSIGELIDKSEKYPWTLEVLIAAHNVFAELKFQEGDLKSTKEILSKIKKICEELKATNGKYIEICKKIASFYYSKQKYLQVLFWYQAILNHYPKDFKDDYTTTLKNFLIPQVTKMHKEQISKLFDPKSEIYTLKFIDNTIIIEIQDKRFYKKIYGLEFSVPFALVNQTIEINALSVSPKSLQPNLDLIKNAYKKYKNKKTADEENKKNEKNKLEIANEESLLNEKPNDISVLKNNTSKDETEESKQASRENREAEKALAKELKKAKQKSKQSENKKSNDTVAVPKPSLVEELGLPEEFVRKNLFPLCNNYIPKGTMYGFFNREKVLEDAANLKISKDVVDQHQKLAEKGEIGNGIKMNTNDDQHPVKTWIPKYTPSGNARVWSTVVKKFKAKTGKVVTIVEFDSMKTHKTQKKMYGR